MDKSVINSKLLQLHNQRGVLVATHRGALGGNIVENTIASFKAAINMGSDIVETDVPRTLDGKLICIHDGMERRLFMFNWIPTNLLPSCIALRRRYINQSLSRLSQKPERLENVLDALKGKCIINVDRCWKHWDKVCEAVASRNMQDEVIFKCVPNPKYLNVLQSQSIPFMFMPIIKEPWHLELVKKFKLNTVAYEFVFADANSPIVAPDVLRGIKESGALLWANAIDIHEGGDLCAGYDDYISLTDNPEKGWGKLLEMGFDIIQTDFPAALHNYLIKKGVRR